MVGPVAGLAELDQGNRDRKRLKRYGRADAFQEREKEEREMATTEIEADLLKRIREDDDPEAKERIFARYEALLHRFAHQYHSDRLPYEDAFQLAALGLMKAMRRFDPERGVSFITFAYPTVEGELKRHYRDHLDFIRLPRRIRDLRQRINVESGRIWEEEGKEPDVHRLSRRLEVGEEEIIEALAAQQSASVFSLDGAPAASDGAPFSCFAGSCDPSFEEVEKEMLISKALSSLPMRHRKVMELRLRKGWTQARIAGELEVSQMQVSRLIREAVEMLRALCSGQDETAW